MKKTYSRKRTLRRRNRTIKRKRAQLKGGSANSRGAFEREVNQYLAETNRTLDGIVESMYRISGSLKIIGPYTFKYVESPFGNDPGLLQVKRTENSDDKYIIIKVYPN